MRRKCLLQPVAGIVLGSGLGDIAAAIQTVARFDAASLPGYPRSTAVGHRGELLLGTLDDVPVAVMNGRVHGYEGHVAGQVVYPVRLLIALGIRTLCVTNACGGVNPGYEAGDVVVLDDLINMMWANPLIGRAATDRESHMVDMSQPFDPELSSIAVQAANEAVSMTAADRPSARIHRGVYLAFSGPCYETPAEYRMARGFGADVVGMSTVPELLAARQAGIRVVGLSVVSNVFRGAETEPASGESVVARVAAVSRIIHHTLRAVVRRHAETSAIVAGRPQSTTPTIALLTPRGRGAVATLRLCGSEAAMSAALDRCFQAANGLPLASQPIGRLCFGHWNDPVRIAIESPTAGATLSSQLAIPGSQPAPVSEDVVITRTNCHVLEIHCHGGEAAVRRICDSLTRETVHDRPFEICSWSEQMPADRSPLAVEFQQAIAATTTATTLRHVVRQASGLFENSVRELLQADTIDRASIDRMLQYAEFGRHLIDPWQIVIAGRPNVGKSTLLNAVMGYARSIVCDEPGTTRDVVTSLTALDGWPMVLADTAGVRTTDRQLEQAGIARTRQALRSTDLVCLVLDQSQPPTDEDHALQHEILGVASASTTTSASQGSGGRSGIRTLIVANKTDLPNAWGEAMPHCHVGLCARDGNGVPELIRAIVGLLVPDTPPVDQPFPVTIRQIECLRQATHYVSAGDQVSAHESLRACLSGTAVASQR